MSLFLCLCFFFIISLFIVLLTLYDLFYILVEILNIARFSSLSFNFCCVLFNYVFITLLSLKLISFCSRGFVYVITILLWLFDSILGDLALINHSHSNQNETGHSWAPSQILVHSLIIFLPVNSIVSLLFLHVISQRTLSEEHNLNNLSPAGYNILILHYDG